eukprot:scaffold51223_cov50-Phaeocystis_antarctica.AAC.2
MAKSEGDPQTEEIASTAGLRSPSRRGLSLARPRRSEMRRARRAHIFALQPHVRQRPAERAGRLCAGLAHAAREQALPPLGLNVLLLGRGRIYGDCLPRGPQFVCGGHPYYMH